VLVTPGKKDASNVYENLGWRVNEPDKKTISTSIKAGLHSLGCPKIPQPRVLLPYNSPPESLANGKVSGPLWIGPLAKTEVLEQLTEEYALQVCGISKERDQHIISLAGWKDEDIEKSNRGVIRSIKKLYQSKDAVGTNGLVTMDELPQWIDIGGPPSPKKLVSALKELGFKASISVISTPAIQTNAPWDQLIDIVKSLN
jgi:tRNA G26 N,N-dimethylase Trm1